MAVMTVELELSVLQHPDAGLGYIAALSITDQLIIAAGGTSSHAPTVVASSNARHFEPRKTPRQLGLRDVIAVGDALWTCGEYGQLAVSRDTGATWKVLDTGTDACLFALALAADGDVWVVGDRGYVARVIDERLEHVDLRTSARLAAVYALGDAIVVLGCDGVMYRWQRGEVTRIVTGATKPLNALALTKLGTWVLVGDGGFIARSPDGAWWARVNSEVEVDLEAVETCADGRLVAVGDRGTILISNDDGRRWQPLTTTLTSHLWSVVPFGPGVLVGGDDGLVAKLAPPGDRTWHDRVNVFGSAQPLDVAFAGGPDRFIARGLPAYLRAMGERVSSTSSTRGMQSAFEEVYGVAVPPEAAALVAAVDGYDEWSTFADLCPSRQLAPDLGAPNLFEVLVRDLQANRGTGLVDAFCGVFCIGARGQGDTFHMELYEWDGPRQVLHYDRETHAFTGVVADSLDSLVYFAALGRARARHRISEEAFAIGLRKLRGRIAPAWDASIDEDDPDFVPLDPKRRDSELFFYRSRWICALLASGDGAEIADIPRLFDADFNQVVPEEQLPARYEACERFIPTALYSMWRAYLFDEPELARYLELGRRHRSRLVRDAASLIDELRAGRNELGTIGDVRAHLAAFRALDLDPRRAEQRKAEAAERARAEAIREQQARDELVQTPRAAWAELAWRWLDDGPAHRALLRELDAAPDVAAQIATLDQLRRMSEGDRAVVVQRLASELAPELEAILVGSLVRDDALASVLAPAAHAPSTDDTSSHDAVRAEGDDGDNDDTPPPARVLAALAMTERALRLAPGDEATQLAHAMLLLDAERAGVAGAGDQLASALPGFSPASRVQIAVRMGEQGHPRFGDALDAVLAGPLPERVIAERDHGCAVSLGDVAGELVCELGKLIAARAPERLAAFVPLVPETVEVLSTLAWEAIQANLPTTALALYERLLELPVPADGADRTNYIYAMNNACVQAHAMKAYETAVRIADRAQPFAHENPHIYHSAACAYAAVGDYAKAFEQVKLAFEHDYVHLGKVEVDPDLGPLLEWPEFKALFREWHARQEGN